MAEAVDDATRRAIEWDCTRLINLYASLNDAAQWEELAALYTIDGTMTRPTAPDTPIVGRDAILAAFRARPPRRTQHFCANIVVSVTSAVDARGTSAMLLFVDATTPPLVGTFADRFRFVTGKGWRFADRRGSLTFA